MKRVVVLGSPGAGKSTFARKLHQRSGLPIVHLDFYYHQSKYDYINNLEAWIARVKKLMEPEEWIIDGNYQSTVPLRCEAADTIILFDLPRRVCMYRVLRRRLQLRNKQRVDMPSEWKEKADWGFLKFVWNFNRLQIPRIVEVIDQNRHKNVAIFKSSADAKRYLEAVKRG
jgi:adenylate kinase family enzyme